MEGWMDDIETCTCEGPPSSPPIPWPIAHNCATMPTVATPISLSQSYALPVSGPKTCLVLLFFGPSLENHLLPQNAPGSQHFSRS